MPLILGADTDNVARIVLVDGSGRPILVIDDPTRGLVGGHGWDGSAWQKLQVDASKRLKVLIDAITSALTVSATDLDIRDLTKTLDNLYAILKTDAGVAYDARDRNWTVTETVPVSQTTPANLTPGIYAWDGSAWQKLLVDSSSYLKVAQQGTIYQHRKGTLTGRQAYDVALGNHTWTERWRYTVDAGKRALVTSYYLYVPKTAALGDCLCRIKAGVNSGADVALIARLSSNTTDEQNTQGYLGLELLASDYISFETLNGTSTSYGFAGQCVYLQGDA